MRTSILAFISAAVVVAAFVGCGGSGTTQCDPGCTGPETTSSDTSASSSTTGGSGGAGGAGGAATTSSTSSTAAASGSTGTGSGTICGGKQGSTCLSTEYCDFAGDKCSLADQTGSCTLRPTSCPDSDPATCGCDGMVYKSPCHAAMAGVDVNTNSGACPAPTDSFQCGPTFCPKVTSYCQRTTSDVGGVPDSYACKSVPAGCGGTTTCGCLAAEPCAALCAPSADGGGIVLTCPGG